MKKIFLSASVPEHNANKEAIKEAVWEVVDTVAKDAECRLVWGGHPTITPMLQEGFARCGMHLSGRVTVYLSREFEDVMPADNVDMGVRIYTERRSNREESLRLMREKMIGENDFEEGVFIGGKEGVDEEYRMFRAMHPETKCRIVLRET